MKLPNDAIIRDEKLTRYLLVFRDEDDKSGYLARAGFTFAIPEDLRQAIRNLVSTNEAVLRQKRQIRRLLST